MWAEILAVLVFVVVAGAGARWALRQLRGGGSGYCPYVNPTLFPEMIDAEFCLHCQSQEQVPCRLP